MKAKLWITEAGWDERPEYSWTARIVDPPVTLGPSGAWYTTEERAMAAAEKALAKLGVTEIEHVG